MTRAQRVALSACACAIAYVLVYVGVDYGKVPRLWYHPVTRSWHVVDKMAGVPMGYFGLWLYALVAAAIVGGGVWLLTGRRKGPAENGTLGLVAAWAGTAWLLGAGYFAWNNWP